MPESPIRTVCAPPPFSSLLPPFRGEVGKGVRRRPAGARGGWRAAVSAVETPPRRVGRRGCGGNRETPRPVCGARVNPPPDLPPERGEERNGGGLLLRPTTTMPESPIRAAWSPPSFSSLLPPFRGEVGRGVRHRPAGARGVWRAAFSAVETPSAGWAAGVQRRSGDPPSGPRSPGQPPLPTSPLKGGRRETAAVRSFVQRRRCRRVLSAPLGLLPPSLHSSPLSGGRSGGGSRAGARARPVSGGPPFPPSRPLGGWGGGGAESVGRLPVRSAEPGSTPLPTSPLKGGRRETAAVRSFVQRRRCRRVLSAPLGLLPPSLHSSPLPGGRSATVRTRVRPRRRTGRRTAAALSPPPFSSLLPPSRGEESGRGTERGRTAAQPPRSFQMRSPRPARTGSDGV